MSSVEVSMSQIEAAEALLKLSGVENGGTHSQEEVEVAVLLLNCFKLMNNPQNNLQSESANIEAAKILLKLRGNIHGNAGNGDTRSQEGVINNEQRVETFNRRCPDPSMRERIIDHFMNYSNRGHIEIHEFCDTLEDSMAGRSAAMGVNMRDAEIPKTKNKAGPKGAGVKSSKPKILVARNTQDHNDSDEMISIGSGETLIPTRVFNNINWNSYTIATRKLLTAVFSRKVLATHCLTGQKSRAFGQKPAKKMLNPGIINDIVQTVTERCGVPRRLVRTSVTNKCADESKMFRTRKEKRKRSNQLLIQDENSPPESESLNASPI